MAEHTFTPTLKMAANARRGLKLRQKFDRGGTSVGVRRAQQLADRASLGEEDVKSMASYFARHAVDKEATAKRWGDVTDPSAGFIAWLLWGGDDGARWAARNRKRIST